MAGDQHGTTTLGYGKSATWREVRRLKGYGGIFSPDSRLMVVNDGVSQIRLEETSHRPRGGLPDRAGAGVVCRLASRRTERG